ncbi:MAG: hypothetical protein U0736_05770 [Gemmataceae bacterium]
MNEIDWLTGDDPTALLAHLGDRASARKLRLFACACVRRGWSLLRYRAPRRAVEVAERFADGRATTAELATAYAEAEMAAGTAPEFEQYAYQAAAATAAEEASAAAAQAREAMRQQAVGSAAYELAPGEDEAATVRLASAAEGRAQCELLRELFGNPFRPSVVQPAWLAVADGAAGVVLRLIDDEERFAELPYLADALEDAGCTDEPLLRHLRQPTGHVRGCWAVDALLGRT